MVPDFSVHHLRAVEVDLGAVGEHAVARRLMALGQALDQRELRVLIFGEFNRGKSTLINALLGRVVLPAKLVPTTGHVTRVVSGPREREEVRVRRADGSTERGRLDQLDTLGSLRDGRAREGIEQIEVTVDAPLLREGIVLIDTPGVNDSAEQTARAEAAVAEADIVLLVLDARQPLRETERTFAAGWMTGELGKPVVPVLNYAASLAPSDRAEVSRMVDSWSRTHLRDGLGRAWFEVDALTALLHARNRGPAPTDDFATLRSCLGKLNGSRRAALQRSSRRSQIRAVLRAVRARNFEILTRLRADARRVEEDRSARRQAICTLARRFDTEARSRRERREALASAEVDERLDVLTSVWFKDEDKSSLEANANRWYQERLSEAIRKIEKGADGDLLTLAGQELRRADPMTVGQRMALDSRLDVGELPMLDASGNLVAGSGFAGAFLGQLLIPIPVVGAVAGAIAGSVLGGIFGQREPDYVAAYSAQAKEKWAVSARQIQATLRAQFDARIAQLRAQIDERIAVVSAPGWSASEELARRERLERGLERCEAALAVDDS